MLNKYSKKSGKPKKFLNDMMVISFNYESQQMLALYDLVEHLIFKIVIIKVLAIIKILFYFLMI